MPEPNDPNTAETEISRSSGVNEDEIPQDRRVGTKNDAAISAEAAPKKDPKPSGKPS